MVGLDALELVHERVVVGVRDGGRVEDVVEVLVMAELGAQEFGALCWVWRGVGWGWVGRLGHGENYIGTAAR